VAQKGGGEPHPYVACLVADGDKVGELLAVLPEAHQQRILSQILSEFATDVRNIVEKQNRGSLIYAGGDDVLAFVTLPNALGCANALRVAFEKRMTEALTALSPVLRPKGQAIPRPTLSVGIGIGHMLERMGDLIQLGRDAEQLAKDGAPEVWGGTERNALAIIQDKRSGGRLSWRTNWREDTLETFNGRCRALVDNTLPTRKVYQIGALLKRMPTRERPDEAEARKAKGLEPQKSLAPHELEDWANHLRGEVSLNLARAQGNRGTSPEAVGLNLHPKVNPVGGDTSYEALRRSVHAWYCQTLIARTCVDAAAWSFRVQGGHDD